MSSFIIKIFNKFKARWDGFSSTQRRVFLLSPVVGFLALLISEVVIRWYGGDPTTPFLNLPPVLVWIINKYHYIPVFTGVRLPPYLTFRQFVYLARVLLLLPWSFYLTYLFLLQPAFSSLVREYRELRGSSYSFSLALLRLFIASPYLPKIFIYPFTIIYLFSLAIGGVLSTFGFLLLLYFSFLSLCYLEFKAGRYLGSEQEFWGELALFSNLCLIRVGPVAFLIGFIYGLYWFYLLNGFAYHTDRVIEERKYYEELSSDYEVKLKKIEQLERGWTELFEERERSLKEREEMLNQQQQQQQQQKSRWF